MAAPKMIHVTPTDSGAWIVRTGASRGGIKVFATQAEAVRAAQASVRDGGGQLHVQDAKGQLKKTFTLGRAAMAKLNAVEGVSLTSAGESAFKAFDRDGLTPTQRRAALRKNIANLSETTKAKRSTTGRTQLKG